MEGGSDRISLDPSMMGMAGGYQLKNPLASMPPPANGGRYGSPDESWWRKMAKMYLEEQKGQQQDPMDAFAARRQAAQDGRLELAPKEPLISDELSQLISIGAKIASAS